MAVLFSGFGLVMLLLSPLTLGLSLFVLMVSYASFPSRVWLEDDRIRASKRLPPDGIAVEDVKSVTLYLQRFAFVPLNRYVVVKYEQAGKVGHLGLNRMYYHAAGFDAAVQLFAEASRLATPEKAQPAPFNWLAAFRYLASFGALLTVIAGVALGCALQFTSIAEQEAKQADAAEEIELRNQGQTMHNGEPIADMEMLEVWKSTADSKLSTLYLLRGVCGGGAALGLLVLLTIWFTRPQAGATG